MWKSVNPRLHFKDRRILISLTKFDQDWPSLTRIDQVWSEFEWLSSIESWSTVLLALGRVHEDLLFDSSRARKKSKTRSYGQNCGKRSNTWWNFIKYFRHKETYFEAAFVRRVFSIYSMSFQKASNFSKIISLPKSRFFRHVKSIPKLSRINIGKWTSNKKISPAALIPKPAVLLPELRMRQDSCHWKVDIASFLEILSLLKYEIGRCINKIVIFFCA